MARPCLPCLVVVILICAALLCASFASELPGAVGRQNQIALPPSRTFPKAALTPCSACSRVMATAGYEDAATINVCRLSGSLRRTLLSLLRARSAGYIDYRTGFFLAHIIRLIINIIINQIAQRIARDIRFQATNFLLKQPGGIGSDLFFLYLVHSASFEAKPRALIRRVLRLFSPLLLLPERS